MDASCVFSIRFFVGSLSPESVTEQTPRRKGGGEAGDVQEGAGAAAALKVPG